MEKRKPLHTVGRNSAATVEYSMEFSQKTKNRTTYDPVIPLLGIYVKKKKNPLIQKDTNTPTFIAALFTVAKIWKQPKCPSIDEWIKM